MAEADVTFSEAREADLDVQLVPRGTSVDPLGDVISWLGQVDLAQTLSDKEIVGEFGRREKNSEGNVQDILPVQAYLHSTLNASARSLHTLASKYSCSASCKSHALTEEDEWTIRQRQTGASGRLVIYDEGDKPQEDIHLRGGYGRRVIVTTVTQGSKAHQAGVKVGDVLVSIGGRKDFQASSADTIHSSLAAPVMLVFMGFVGKLQAEVKLNQKENVAGFSSKHQIVYPNPHAQVHVLDEVFFQPGSSDLVLTVAHAPNSRDDLQTAAHSSCEEFEHRFPTEGKRLVSDDDTHCERMHELHDSDELENSFPTEGKRLDSDDFEGMYDLHDSDEPKNSFPIEGKRLDSDDGTLFEGTYLLHDSDAQTVRQI